MQLRVIERVEKLGAELNLTAFRSLRQWNPTEYFKQREIPVVAARPNDDIASCGAERQRHRRRKRIRLEPLVYLLGTVIRIAEENGADLHAAAHARVVAGVGHGHMQPGFERRDAGELPSTQSSAHQLALAGFEERQVPHIVQA